MRPIAVLNGILLGSAVAITAGSAVTLLIVGLLRGETTRLDDEWRPLLVTTLLFAVVSTACAVALTGHLRGSRWRWWAQGLVVVSLVAVGSFLWWLR